ncbi:ABC transporter permease [Phytoactinopolyspora halophila]|uniref:ABC transporter permease n=1 Tax=Phytoactinopolyspora halophila TaxID=1981511 RepID=UPI001B8C6DFD|nr:ABC transporter permease [Phytoactinopolyspora halophila]
MSTETNRPATSENATDRPPSGDEAQGITIAARTQGQLIRRRFFRHRAAMGGMITLLLVIVLAFTSIGFGPIPGWWDKSYLSTGSLVNDGDPTLSLVPAFLGGDGIRLGEHPFGQDDVGKDYFALVMRGAQQSLIIAFVIGIVSTVVGAVVGALAGYFRGRTEGVLMRLTDVVISIPTLVFAAILAAAAGRAGIVVLGVAIGLVIWTGLARLVRGEFLALREKEFVEAARAAGTKPSRIIFKHMMPNAIGVIIVSATLAVAVGILLETALSYLGLGVRPPDVSLGSLVSLYETAMTTRPSLFWWPGIFIVIIALSVNFIGDGLRDAFDPRQTRVRE